MRAQVGDEKNTVRRISNKHTTYNLHEHQIEIVDSKYTLRLPLVKTYSGINILYVYMCMCETSSSSTQILISDSKGNSIQSHIDSKNLTRYPMVLWTMQVHFGRIYLAWRQKSNSYWSSRQHSCVHLVRNLDFTLYKRLYISLAVQTDNI